MRVLLTSATALIAGLQAAPPVGAAPTPPDGGKVDVVVLQNGTRVVGEIRSMSRGRRELETDDMGTIYVEWGNVAQVTAPGFFEVEDMEGGLYFGSLRPGQAEGRSRSQPTGARTRCCSAAWPASSS